MSIEELITIKMTVHIKGEQSMTGLRKEEVDQIRQLFLERLRLFKEQKIESKLELPEYGASSLAWDAMVGVRPKEPYVNGKLKDGTPISIAETDIENVYSLIQGVKNEDDYVQFLLILSEKPGAFWKSKNIAKILMDGLLGLFPSIKK